MTFASLAEMANFMKGAKIVKEGDPGESFYVALVGEAKVTVKGKSVQTSIYNVLRVR